MKRYASFRFYWCKGLFLLLMLWALLFSGCISIEPVKIRSVQCCELKNMQGTEADVAFQFEIENPNDFEITIKSYDLTVKLNSIRVGRLRSVEFSVLAPNSVTTKDLSMRTSAKTFMNGSLLMGLGSLLGLSAAKPEVEIIGSVVAKAKGFSKRIKLRRKFPLDMNLKR